MPVREGRWISWSQLKAAEEAAKAADPEPEKAPDPEPIKPKRSRRSTRAAQAAIAEATGLDINVEV